MTTLFVSTGNALAVVRRQNGDWRADLKLQGVPTQCVAVDPLRPEHVYCGTFGQGLWRSRDAGSTWEQVGPGIGSNEVMAVAVSLLERLNGEGVVWAGTEPSALYRSEDGGRSWVERPGLKYLPSAPTWSFPPRPWTHHVRWIQPDPNVAERIFVGIELGGVMRSVDGGLTWEDRKPGAQPDSHTLRAHRLAPGRVYEAAGGGFAESEDGGVTWHGEDAGLAWHYLWGLAVDPADPETVVVSVSPGPRHAHDATVPAQSGTQRGAIAGSTAAGAPTARGSRGGPPWAGYGYQGPEAAIYRRSGHGPWQQVQDGLPEPRGTLAYVLAAHDAEPHVFYGIPHGGEIYRSADAGLSWDHLHVEWPAGFQIKSVDGLAIAEMA
jgi:hypothetical protein